MNNKRLDDYKRRRDFQATTEPTDGAKKSNNSRLRFVVQKHDARNLHYDFRLELNGVLKSWAVPKGIPENNKERHLAMMVEDHPFDYRNFEGVIPEGNYGAGKVMIWDEGFYSPLEIASKKKQEEDIRKSLEDGHLTFLLYGQKLEGEYALVKLKKSKEKDAWLLIKAAKGEEKKIDPNLKELSVRSGRRLEEVSDQTNSQDDKSLDNYFQNLSPSPLPRDVVPMKANLIKEPFDNKDWVFEIKWDGYRAIAEIVDGKVALYSRNNLSFNSKFPSILNSLQDYPKDAIFDGEIVALDDKGRSDFQRLQNYLLNGEGDLIYYVFDLLYYDRFNLMNLDFLKRRQILRKVLSDKINIRLSEELPESGKSFFEAAKKSNLEGIVGKKIDSTYTPGRRSENWAKIKNILEQDFVIGGYTAPKGGRVGFGSLLVGIYDRGELNYVSNVGTGFNDKLIKELMDLFSLIEIDNSPFANLSRAKDTIWLEPKLVAEIKFEEWTKDGGIRQPVFLGLREDVKPEEVRKEV